MGNLEIRSKGFHFRFLKILVLQRSPVYGYLTAREQAYMVLYYLVLRRLI